MHRVSAVKRDTSRRKRGDAGEERRQEAAARLRLALDLFAAGEELMRQNLRRRYADASAAQIEERLVAWLSERPGAELGDAVGRPVKRSRVNRNAG